MRVWLVLGLTGFLGLLAVGQSSSPPSPAQGKPKANDTFAALRQQWAQNLHRKRIDAAVAEYTADAEFLDPSGERVAGAAALRSLFDTVTATFDSDLSFDSVRTETSGDLAYDSGTYKETLIVRATGNTQHASGSYLTIYRRGKDGAWLIVEQMWTRTVN